MRQQDKWWKFPWETQELILRNLRETITDKVQQEDRVSKEQREGFVDNHEAVHAELERQLASRNPGRAAARDLAPINTSTRVLERHPESQLERQLSSRNPRQAAGREQTPIGYHARDLKEHLDSQEEWEENDGSFDYSNTAFARTLGLLDDDPASLVDSQELTRGLAQERTVCPGLANRLSLSLDESQEGRATVGENILQNNNEGQNDEDGENGVYAIKRVD